MTYGCTSLDWVTKCLFLENQPSLTRLTFWKTLSQKICHTPRSWRSVHRGWHGTATYFYQPSPTCCEICIQFLDQTAISTDSYHTGSIKAQERLRRSSPEIILAGSAVRQPYYPRASMQTMTQKTVMSVMLYGVVSRPGFQAVRNKYGSLRCGG